MFIQQIVKYCVPDTVLGTGDTEQNRQKSLPLWSSSPWSLYSQSYLLKFIGYSLCSKHSPKGSALSSLF